MGEKGCESVDNKIIINGRGHYVVECRWCGCDFFRRIDSKTEFCGGECRSQYNNKDKLIECEVCGVEFLPRDSTTRYCSYKCSGIGSRKDNFISCDNCGEDINRLPCMVNTHNNFCNKECHIEYQRQNSPSGENHHNWKNGVCHSGGYKLLTQGDGSYKLEHRIIMENLLGRKLSSNEIIHHIDHNKLNNDITNLQIMSREEHSRLHTKHRWDSGVFYG